MIETKIQTVCHLVGGLTDHGGTWSYARSVAVGGARGNIQHLLWMHRRFQPKDPALKHILRGWATQVNCGLARDLVGGLTEAIPLLRWVWNRREVVLHAHSRPCLIAAALVCWLTRRPLVVHIHGLPRWPRVYHILCQLGRGTLVFNSHKTCRHLGCAPERSHIVTPTITWPPPPPASSEEATRFVAAAMFVSWKNLHLIIDAFDRLRSLHPSIRVDIFGDPGEGSVSAYARFLRQRAQRTPGVRLRPYDPAWLDQWRPSDVFVHAAENEPFGIVLLEAFARGCRMALPMGTFLDELPSPYRTEGIFCAKRLDAQGLAEAMAQAWLCPAKAEDLWRRRRDLQDQFSIRHTMVQLESIYRDAVLGS